MRRTSTRAPQRCSWLASIILTALTVPSGVQAQCPGDCGHDGKVTVDEVLTLVNIALTSGVVTACELGDINHDTHITVDEILTAVNNALVGCSATPTPTKTTSTPAVATQTSTPTSTQSPTQEPTAAPRCQTLKVTVSLVYDANAVPDLAGLVVDLNYPGASVELPGSGSDDSVIERVTDVSGAGGLSIVQDLDTDSNGTDDQVHNVYAAPANIPPGNFEEVLFDCTEGTSVPPSAAFSCSVSQTADSQGSAVEGVQCTVSVSPMFAPTATPTPTATVGIAVCGDGVTEPGETCDDGNTVTNPPADICPSDCTVITCTPAGGKRVVSVSFTPPAGKNVASITVLLEYPDGTVQILGTGADDTVAAAIANTPSGVAVAVFDYDYAVKVGLPGTRTIPPGELLHVTFDACQGAAAPTAANFKCTVLDAAAPTTFLPVSGVTCAAAVL